MLGFSTINMIMARPPKMSVSWQVVVVLARRQSEAGRTDIGSISDLVLEGIDRLNFVKIVPALAVETRDFGHVKEDIHSGTAKCWIIVDLIPSTFHQQNMV
jgi:hypothetical protein